MARQAQPKLPGASGASKPPPKTALTAEAFGGWVNEVLERKTKLTDAQMAHASVWKRADALQIDPKAAKIAIKIYQMDGAEGQQLLRNINRYSEMLGVTAQLDMLDAAEHDQGKLNEVRDAGAAAAEAGHDRVYPGQDPTLAAHWESGYDEKKRLMAADGAPPADAPTGDKAPSVEEICDQAKAAFEAGHPRRSNPWSEDHQKFNWRIWDTEYGRLEMKKESADSVAAQAPKRASFGKRKSSEATAH